MSERERERHRARESKRNCLLRSDVIHMSVMRQPNRKKKIKRFFFFCKSLLMVLSGNVEEKK